DGLSNTVIIGEKPPAPSLGYGWYTSGDIDVVWGVANTHRAYATNTDGTACDPTPCFFRAPYPGGPTNRCNTNHFHSYHTGGGNWAFGDGSVHFLPFSASQILLPLSTYAGGEVVDGSKF